SLEPRIGPFPQRPSRAKPGQRSEPARASPEIRRKLRAKPAQICGPRARMDRRLRPVYEFGPFRLELAEFRLLRDGSDQKLRAKLFDLLVVLVEHAGEMVEKGALLNAVWPDAAVEESNLTVSINALRKALGEPACIETVASRGYRFIAEVRMVAANP